MQDLINHWRTLEYHDPGQILRRLRALEIELAGVQIDATVGRLRTNELKKYREWRDAALFTYGMGLAQDSSIRYATEEDSDYDFVATWDLEGRRHFCPVQLKELVPADLNPAATLDGLLRKLRPAPAPSYTVLAVRLNRAGHLDLKSLALPKIPFAQLWFFWASAPNGTRWSLFGDALGTPGQVEFDYPQ